MITKDAKGIVVVQNIIMKDISSAKELLQLIKTGSANRHVESTNMNEHSSRSQLLISVYIETRPVKSSQEYTLGMYSKNIRKFYCDCAAMIIVHVVKRCKKTSTALR